jgi:hypothetical protein
VSTKQEYHNKNTTTRRAKATLLPKESLLDVVATGELRRRCCHRDGLGEYKI